MASDILSKARDYAFLLLKYRQRSRDELRQRLERKKFPAGIVRQVLDSLEEKGFLDDQAFTRDWTSSRASAGIGPRRIRQELRVKGIDEQLIQEGLRLLKQERPEAQTIRQLVEQRWPKLKGKEPQTAKRRLYAYLIRRGFSPEAVIETIESLE